MRKRFQILNDPRFNLVYNEMRRFQEGPAPTSVRLNREHFDIVDGVKKKTHVYPGMLLATHESALKGDVHSPIYGVITEITPLSILITAEEKQESDPILEPKDFLKEGLEGEELALQMKAMGVNMRSLGQKIKTLIINGLNPDPGITWAEPMLQTHVETLRQGMELHKRLVRADKLILVIPKGSKVAYEDVETVYVDAEYPMSVDPLLIREVTGEENPPDVGVVGLHNIWSLGRVGMTGLPLMETVITISAGSKWENYIVKQGITAGQLLDFANVKVNDGDTVLRGGPLRGESLDSLDRSITKGTTGLFVVEATSVPPIDGQGPCVNCGACVRICPAQLNPCTISRYAEFANYNACFTEQSTICMECGLCSYVCIARRPVMQYIRLANKKVKEMEDFEW